MSLCGRRHYYSSLRNLAPTYAPTTATSIGTEVSSPHSEILHLCSSGCLSQALRRLRSADSRRLLSKPLVFASLLQACVKAPSFSLGVQLHTHVLKSGLDADRFVGNSLLALYFKLCPDIDVTRKVFDELPIRDVVAWSSMVSGYIHAGRPGEAVGLVKVMWALDVDWNAFTLSSGIKACSEMGDLMLGRCFHGVVIAQGYDLNDVISSALIDMYGRNCAPDDALGVFKEMALPDAICWTSVISAFTRNDRFVEALVFFRSMHREHVLVPDCFTYGSVLTALGNLGRLRQGMQVHAMVIISGISGNVVVECSMVDMYAKSKSMRDSRRVFDRMAVKNAVSWCALLGGYCQSGDYTTVLQMFREMDKEDDNYSLSTVLRACAGLSDLRHGKEVHCQFLRTKGRSVIIVESALIDLYAKCGLVYYAYRVFENIVDKNLITWNAMICGFAQNGKSIEAVNIFNDMVANGFQPDYISFIGVLFACSHSGLVDEGRRYFRLLTKDYGISPGIEHYNCMVDLLGRAGLLGEAEGLIKDSVFKDESSLWAALLGACATYSDPLAAERVAKRMMQLDPDYHLSYVLLANIYKTVGLWDEASEILRKMKQKGIKKTEGKSWI
ncbi:hypothetical protein Taro_038706 [Colocasia esculenta]|uniref:Pentatricopeptide repeat-containing protein n=1 Tax=Colocasia esculenta TaxID=4460 RepID=A0A843WK20_COLES|nr:hypothetical protein [Colocasia esculenta]